MPKEFARSVFDAGTVTLHGRGTEPQAIRIYLPKNNNPLKDERIEGLVRKAEKEFGFGVQRMDNPRAYVLSGSSPEWNQFKNEVHKLVIDAKTIRKPR